MHEREIFDEDTIKNHLNQKISEYIEERLSELIEGVKYPILPKQKRQRYKNFSDSEINTLTGIKWDGVEKKIKGYLPSRTNITVFAEYLGCSQVETAELMAIAGYLPEDLPYNHFDANTTYSIRREIVDLLQFPAYLLTEEWNIIEWNNNIIKMLGLEELESTLKNLPDNQRNLLWLIFDKDLPIREMIEEAEEWKDMAIRNVHGFILDNLLQTQQSWYMTALNNFKQLEEFFATVQKKSSRRRRRLTLW
jgi:hypothetical protein